MASLPVMGLSLSTIYASEAFFAMSFQLMDLPEIYATFVDDTEVDWDGSLDDNRGVLATYNRRP